MLKNLVTTVALLVSASCIAIAQQPCQTNTRLEGIVTDATGAVIAGAHVETSDGRRTTSDTSGHYVFTCPASGTFDLHFTADGFTEGHLSVTVRDSRSLHADIRLAVAAVQSEVQVSGDDPSETVDRTTGMGVPVVRNPDRRLTPSPQRDDRNFRGIPHRIGSTESSRGTSSKHQL